MAARFLAALVLGFATLAAQAAGMHGAFKPNDPLPKVAERLMLSEPREVTELRLPTLADEAKRALEGAMKPNQIGVSRRGAVEAAGVIDAGQLRWTETGGVFVAQLRIASPGAASLRTGLRFTAMPADLEIRAAASFADAKDVTRTTAAQLFKLTNGAWPIEHWTASTEGETQVIELATARRPAPGALELRVFDVSHVFTAGPKVEFTCHVDIACIADPAVRQDGRAVARMRFVEGGGTFVCTGALLNDSSSSFTPLFATANHCISTAAVAATLEAAFFFYPDVCGGPPAAPTRVTGATLLMADFNSDMALLRLAQSAPAGSFFLGWDSSAIPVGSAVFGIHHPAGEFQRYSAGTLQGSISIVEAGSGLRHNAPFNRIQWTQGLTEGGSSGSPLLTGAGNFRGTLFGGPAGNSCADAQASYSDFSNAYPLVASFLAGPGSADDHADSPAGATPVAPASRRVALINRDGDADWFRVTFTTAGVWTIGSFDPAEGNPRTDVVGEVFAADGATRLAVNDDRAPTDRNFEIALTIPAPGTYLVRVTGAAGVTGAYGLSSAFAPPDDFGDTPATAAALSSNTNIGGRLGSSADEDWFRISFDRAGLFRVTSTGTTDVFARLYRSDGVTQISESDDIVLGVDTNFSIAANVNGVDTYYLRVTGFDGDIGAYGLVTSFSIAGEPPNYTDLWWNAAESGWGINLNHQANLIFATLFTYAADGRNLWLVADSLARQPDGTYTGALYRTNGPVFNAQPWTSVTATQVGTMTLTFSSANAATLVYSFNGTTVTKQITRQRFGPSPTCVFTTGGRTGATNLQDLWFNSSESGWGINLTQQGSTILATLFTYAADNRDLWLVADSLARQPDDSFRGNLLRTTGPPFNAQPWTPITVATVGTMTLRFSSGSAGTLTYTVDGVSVTKPIERQVFGAQPTQCH